LYDQLSQTSQIVPIKTNPSTKGAKKAHLVTSAFRFTPATINTAKRASESTFYNIDIELIALGKLMNMMNVSNKKSWIHQQAFKHYE